MVVGSHLGTAGHAAEHGNEGYDEKLSKVVRAFSARGSATSSTAERKMSMAVAGSKR
jgi:hypothetical protein